MVRRFRGPSCRQGISYASTNSPESDRSASAPLTPMSMPRMLTTNRSRVRSRRGSKQASRHAQYQSRFGRSSPAMTRAGSTARPGGSPCAALAAPAAAPISGPSVVAPRHPDGRTPTWGLEAASHYGFLRDRRPRPTPCRCPRARRIRVVGRLVGSLPAGSTRLRGPSLTPLAIRASCPCGMSRDAASTTEAASFSAAAACASFGCCAGRCASRLYLLRLRARIRRARRVCLRRFATGLTAGDPYDPVAVPGDPR